MNMDETVFKFVTGSTLSFEYSYISTLPVNEASTPSRDILEGFLLSTGRKNLSKAQEELLLRLSVLGHYNIANTQTLMRAKVLEEELILIPKELGTHTCNIPL